MMQDVESPGKVAREARSSALATHWVVGGVESRDAPHVIRRERLRQEKARVRFNELRALEGCSNGPTGLSYVAAVQKYHPDIPTRSEIQQRISRSQVTIGDDTAAAEVSAPRPQATVPASSPPVRIPTRDEIRAAVTRDHVEIGSGGDAAEWPAHRRPATATATVPSSTVVRIPSRQEIRASLTRDHIVLGTDASATASMYERKHSIAAPGVGRNSTSSPRSSPPVRVPSRHEVRAAVTRDHIVLGPSAEPVGPSAAELRRQRLRHSASRPGDGSTSTASASPPVRVPSRHEVRAAVTRDHIVLGDGSSTPFTGGSTGATRRKTAEAFPLPPPPPPSAAAAAGEGSFVPHVPSLAINRQLNQSTQWLPGARSDGFAPPRSGRRHFQSAASASAAAGGMDTVLGDRRVTTTFPSAAESARRSEAVLGSLDPGSARIASGRLRQSLSTSFRLA